MGHLVGAISIDDLVLVTQNVRASADASVVGFHGAHSRFPGHALTPTGVMAIRCKQFHLPDL